MPQVSVKLYVHEKDNPKKVKKVYTIKTTDNEDLVISKSVNAGDKEVVAEIPIRVDGTTPEPPEPPNTHPTVDAGEDQTVFEGDIVTLDGSAHDNGKIVEAFWKGPDGIKIDPDPKDMTNATFTAPKLREKMDVLGMRFRFQAEDDLGNISQDSMFVTVKRRTIPIPNPNPDPDPFPEPDPTPTPEPTPEPNVKPKIEGLTIGKLLWSSNRDGKWNNGQKRIVTEQEGNIAADGKGIYLAASGDPELHIKGDGSAMLVSGSGGVDNNSLKTGGNRHQRGGACSNRFGGPGSANSHTTNDHKIEDCHNIHEKGEEADLPEPLEDYVKYQTAYVVTHKNGKIQQITYIDYNDGKGWTKVNDTEFSNPKPHYMDKAKAMEHSEFWDRINNADHGRFYGAACNYDSVYVKQFMFMPKENAVWMRDVELWEVIA